MMSISTAVGYNPHMTWNVLGLIGVTFYKSPRHSKFPTGYDIGLIIFCMFRGEHTNRQPIQQRSFYLAFNIHLFFISLCNFTYLTASIATKLTLQRILTSNPLCNKKDHLLTCNLIKMHYVTRLIRTNPQLLCLLVWAEKHAKSLMSP